MWKIACILVCLQRTVEHTYHTTITVLVKFCCKSPPVDRFVAGKLQTLCEILVVVLNSHACTHSFGSTNISSLLCTHYRLSAEPAVTKTRPNIWASCCMLLHVRLWK
jgi:hypothetical protein